MSTTTPARATTNQRAWGPHVRLLSLRSKRNWGVGDFTDLRNVAVWAQSKRAGIVSLEPIQPIARTESAVEKGITFASHSFINGLYIDVDLVADFIESEDIQRQVLAPQFQTTLNQLRAASKLDLNDVWSAKQPVLQHCYQHFREVHLSKKTERAKAFRKFQSQGGASLAEFSLFQAIKERLALQTPNQSVESWESWPEAYRGPESAGSKEFAESNLERIEHFQYLQWLADLQLSLVESYCLDNNVAAGLLLKQPEQILESGFESWTTANRQASNTKTGAVKSTTAVRYLVSPDQLPSVNSDHHPTLLISLLPFLHSETESNKRLDWRARVPVEIEALNEDPALQEAVKALTKARPMQSGEFDVVDEGKQTATLPASTYRFQFNKEFTYKMAEKLVPYLAKLGISHCYASPLLKARPGSMHGYDIISHKELNPEIGTAAEFDSFVKTLKRNGMGLILDIVPNHMGIGKVNPWWMDVLENGPASLFADYFDIDWAPIKPELYGKVTIPVLGEAYGAIVKGGHFKLAFSAEKGALKLIYYDHEFPLNPLTYPRVLNLRIDVLKERLGKNNMDVMEYQSIVTALMQLPSHTERVGSNDRIREKDVQMIRLANLCKRNAEITHFIEQNLAEFDVRPGDRAAAERMHALLEAQAYRLVFWRVATDEINYRRFFDVNDLAAVRTEDPRVFSEMHDLVFNLLGEGKIDGLRIDHPDGLFDPAAYFDQLQIKGAEKLNKQVPSGAELSLGKDNLPVYIVVEKILAPFEHLEEDWAVHGTVGYDFLNSLQDIFIASENEEAIDLIYKNFAGRTIEFDRLKRECKGLILDTVLASELHVLAHRLNEIAQLSWNYRDFTLNSLRTALRHVVINFPVYRTYVTQKKADKNSKQFIDWAVRLSKRYGPSVMPEVYDFVRNVLCLEAMDPDDDPNSEGSKQFMLAVQTFAMKFQQFTGPVMAKSVEDTLFYRFNRFIALNEVGGEPDCFGISTASFHHQNQQRQVRRPYEMLATSTHDTKRSEDVRARLAVISELPKLWEQKVVHWARVNRTRKTEIEDEQAPDANDEYLIYQTLIGACPFDTDGVEWIEPFKARISEYILKAARESKSHTSWVNKYEPYENALTSFVDKILSPANNLFLDEFLDFNRNLVPIGLLNGLAQTLLKFTCPGVPDIYQGNELWDYSLVDPDNRRSVDFKIRARYLDEVKRSAEMSIADVASDKDRSYVDKLLADIFRSLEDGRSKLLVTAVALACRNKYPDIFTKGKYIPLEVKGIADKHVVAFARECDGQTLIVLAPRLLATLLKLDDPDRIGNSSILQAVLSASIWKDTTVVLPSELSEANFVNLFSLENVSAKDGGIMAADAFKQFPVALLRIDKS